MKYYFIVLMMFASKIAPAHEPDLSSVVISKTPEGKYIMQIIGALTAFDGEVKYVFGENSFKTPEAFRALVIKNFRRNFLLIVNKTDTLQFKNPVFLLGHETKLVVELTGMPKNIEHIYLKNSMFADMPRNKSALMMIDKEFPGSQYILDNANRHEVFCVI